MPLPLLIIEAGSVKGGLLRRPDDCWKEGFSELEATRGIFPGVMAGLEAGLVLD
jgi:hypothetical protein